MQPPPAMPWGQAIWVFVGVFITMLTIAAVNEAISSSHQYSIILGPFGALMTLQYGLTAAPASQPRNALYGQVISISIALIVNVVIPATSEWVRVPVTSALAVSTMCKAGMIHPPAGAAAVIFSSSDRSPVYFGLLLVGNVIAIFYAILINNLNDKKQYPVYYAFIGERWKSLFAKQFKRYFPCCCKKKKLIGFEDTSARSARSARSNKSNR